MTTKGSMLAFVAKRLGLGVVTLFAVSIVVFLATQALPGDASTTLLGQERSPQQIEALRQQLHLDRSMIEQYVQWIGGLLHGDLGTSFATRQAVSDYLGDRIVNSLTLVMLAACVGIPLSLLIGVATALRRGTPFDAATSTLILVLASLPEFVVGIALITLFSTAVLHLFPAVSLLNPDEPVWANPSLLVLPAATLVIAVVPYLARLMRGSMIDVLDSEYVQMARLKGLPKRLVVYRHAMRNALPATIQVIALQLAWLAGGVVLVEYIFQYPGIGAALVEAVANRDIPIVQAIALLIAAVYVVVNTFADLATILVTPRLREPAR